ncbi:MAG: ATP-binding protein [Chloroflexi bacterium]|nr:ATP-binding protein [Chloroflexota bacterium]
MNRSTVSARRSLSTASSLRPAIELVRTLRQADLPPAVPFRLVDALFLGVSAGVIGGLLLFNGPDAVTLAAVALAVLLYPRFRRVTIRAADRLFLSDLRERAAIESAEEERARLARDIHDTSLQELAGVIGQLQGRPDTAQESEALRRVAEQLRRMSTELRPPVLDDLGLGAALAFVADRTRRPGLEVTASIDGAGIERDTRAPASVELAVFRIVEQALSNVLLHSGASRVRVGGTVAADRVEVSVRDDGRGIARADLEVAARRGRLGLASMRRRAELIGATLHVDGASGSGTTVSVRWSR